MNPQTARLGGRPVSDEQLRVELVAMRHFLAPEWAQWLDAFHDHASADDNAERVSFFASAFLAKALGPGWVCAGGTPLQINPTTFEVETSNAGGFRSASGWKPHGWATGYGWIADISASEIGGEAVILTNVNDLRYRATFNDSDMAINKKTTRARVQGWYTHWIETEAQRVLALRSR